MGGPTNVAHSYMFGVRWIAENDEPMEMDVEVVQGMVSVLLLSDLYNVNEKVVARDVVEERERSK